MNPVELRRRMLSEREFWVDVAPGKRVKVLRPLLDEASALQGGEGAAVLRHYLRGWEGINESDLTSSGGDNPVPFELAIATLMLRDNLPWALKIVQAIGEQLDARNKAVEDVEKNSEI